MKRRPVPSIRQRVLRQRRIYTRFADAWEALRNKSESVQAARNLATKTVK